jgi:glycine/D-amino acid oxidase-like deaminating enzyme
MDDETAQVTPLELTTKLMAAAEAMVGTCVVIGAVAGVETDGAGNATAVRLSNGEMLPCTKVVVAMGPWSCLLEDWLDDGTRVPMQGIKSTSVSYNHEAAASLVKARSSLLSRNLHSRMLLLVSDRTIAGLKSAQV